MMKLIELKAKHSIRESEGWSVQSKGSNWQAHTCGTVPSLAYEEKHGSLKC